jgi:hypothetical protein
MNKNLVIIILLKIILVIKGKNYEDENNIINDKYLK